VAGQVKITGGSPGFNKVLTSDSTGLASWQTVSFTAGAQNLLQDADSNTKIQVEESANDDIIRFDMAGTEFFRMDSGRLEVFNTGQSVFIGSGAGFNDNYSNNQNVAVGDSALFSNTLGQRNVATGFQALRFNTRGSENVAYGFKALRSNTSGSGNLAFGRSALNYNTTGANNTAVGKAALRENTEGDENIAIGLDALHKNTVGYLNLAIGSEALGNNYTGNFNMAIGAFADVASDSLTNANAIGANAIVGQSNSLVLGSINGVGYGTANTKVGIGTTTPDTSLHIVGNIKIEDGKQQAGYVLTADSAGVGSWQIVSAGAQNLLQDADSNTKIQVEESANDDIIRFDMAGTEFFRMDSGRIEVVNTGQSVFIGDGAGANDAFSDNENTAIGYQALYSNTKGSGNVASGIQALYSNTEGYQNVASGRLALYSNTTGNFNVASGPSALYSNTMGSGNVANGNQALVLNTTGYNNVASGTNALLSNTTGSDNTAIGHLADVSTGNLTNATAIGANAVVSQDSSLVLGDAANVGIGTSSPGHKLHVSGGDVRIDSTLRVGPAGGYGTSITQSSLNTDIHGRMATNDYFRIYATGTNDDGALVIQTGDNDTEPILFQQGASERMRIHSNGNVGIGTSTPTHPLHMGSGAHVTAGGVWTNASDRAKKYDIKSLSYGLEEVLQMKPSIYKYKADSSESIGFIAQNLETIIPEVVSGEEGEKGVAYGLLTAVVVNATQEQQQLIEELQTENEKLKAENQSLQEDVLAIKAQNVEMKTQNQALEVKVNEVDILKAENEKQQAEIEQIKAMLGMNKDLVKK